MTPNAKDIRRRSLGMLARLEQQIADMRDTGRRVRSLARLNPDDPAVVAEAARIRRRIAGWLPRARANAEALVAERPTTDL
jgi:hypothetical protein